MQPTGPGDLPRFRHVEVNFGELAQVIVMWMHQIPHSPTRRDMLGKLSAALAVATAAPLTGLAGMTPQANAAPAAELSKFDQATLTHCEAMMPNLRKQGDVLGASATLPSALAYRRIAELQAKAAPTSTLRDRAVAAYAELTQLSGWLCFNMGDYGSAQRFYDDARAAAHEARAVELVTYILCTMSHLATWQGKPRVGIDHAVAAAAWAEQSGSPYARAYAADVAVRALTADGQADRSRDTLDREYAALQTVLTDEGPHRSWWYFYDESFFWSTSAQNALKFHNVDRVLAATDKALRLSDPSNLHERSFRLLFRAEAFARQQSIGLACQTITEVVELTSLNSTRRIEQRVQELRRVLDPWRRTRAVKELDQTIHDYRSMPA
jgi:tetratricopeptide (TPR) repeat protein